MVMLNYCQVLYSRTIDCLNVFFSELNRRIQRRATAEKHNMAKEFKTETIMAQR
jgi:hypothetical protein